MAISPGDEVRLASMVEDYAGTYVSSYSDDLIAFVIERTTDTSDETIVSRFRGPSAQSDALRDAGDRERAAIMAR